LYADVREIPRSLSLLKRCLFLERGETQVSSWILLALLLSSQKKHASAIRACAQGLAQLQLASGAAGAQLPPFYSSADFSSIYEVPELVRSAAALLLTQARLQAAHTPNAYEDAINTFNELVRLTFPPNTAHAKPVLRSASSSSSGPQTRPVFVPSRRRDANAAASSSVDGGSGGGGKTSGGGASDGLAHPNSRPVVSALAHEWAATRIGTLLALANLYAAQAAAQQQPTSSAAAGASSSTAASAQPSSSSVQSGATGAASGAPSSASSSVLARDDSLLSDALSCASFAAEVAPPALLPEVHATLGALYAQVATGLSQSQGSLSGLGSMLAGGGGGAGGGGADALAGSGSGGSSLSQQLQQQSLLRPRDAVAANHSMRHYERALALDSQHIPALIGLARLEVHRPAFSAAAAGSLGAAPSSTTAGLATATAVSSPSSGNLVLAYGYLLQALQVDATSHAAWFEMALVLSSQGKSGAAAEHFLTALQLERTAPIVSFATVRREV
jgi:tetratricopeptide (TPR) repeat protein